MKFPPLLIATFRVCGVVTLLFGLIVLWRSMPFWPSNHPPKADGLPVGWTPAGTDFALQWSTPYVGASQPNLITGPSGWTLSQGKLCFVVREEINQGDRRKTGWISIADHGDFTVLGFPRDVVVYWLGELSGGLWCLGQVHPDPQKRIYALRLDPATAKIEEVVQVVPDPTTPAHSAPAGFRPVIFPLVPNEELVLLSSFTIGGNTAYAWRPEAHVRELQIRTVTGGIRAADFRLDNGHPLLQGAYEIQEVLADQSQLVFQARGQQVTTVHNPIPQWPAWEEGGASLIQLSEPPMRLQQSYYGMKGAQDWTQIMPLQIQGSQDVLQAGQAIDAWIQKPFIERQQVQQFQSAEHVTYLARPMSLTSPSGTVVLADDLGQGEIESRRRQHYLSPRLLRLNATEALVTQVVPYPNRPEQLVLRFGVLTSSSTAVNWIGWSALPPLPAGVRLWFEQVSILVKDGQWTLGFTCFVIGLKRGPQTIAITATMPQPPGVTVDGTGWLISSR